MKENTTIQKKAVGKKTAGKEKSTRSYTLYDTCDKCTLWVYIELVCEDNIEALIVEGKPTKEELEDAKRELLFEFSNMMSDFSNSKELTSVKNIYKYKSELTSLVLCANLVSAGDTEKIKDELKLFGIYAKTNEEIIKKIESKIKSVKLRLNIEYKNVESTRKEEYKPQKSDFAKMLVVLSKFSGYKLDKYSITLEEYAEHIKLYNEHIEAVNQKNTNYEK